MTDLRIAWCGVEAARAVHELTQAAFADQAALHPPSGATRETPEAVSADLAGGRGVLAHLGPRPVAAARVLLLDAHLHIRRVAVHPAYQRRGIAHSVMGWLHGEAAGLGYREVRLGVRTALPSNKDLYASLGYEQVADHGYWVEMALRLAAHEPG